MIGAIELLHIRYLNILTSHSTERKKVPTISSLLVPGHTQIQRITTALIHEKVNERKSAIFHK